MIKLNGKPIDFRRYNDNSCRASIPLPPKDKEVIITWCYESDIEWIRLLYTVEHLRSHFYYDITLDMPMVPNARQDRTKNPEEVFTLKYSCNLLNSMNFDRVKIFDPHSSVSAALIDRVIVNYPKEEIKMVSALHPTASIFFPDEGAMKRYCSYVNAPYSFGVKIRNWETQKVESLKIAGDKHCLAGHDIIIIDDLLSRGSTLYEAAHALKEQGANNIYCWISHCENTVLEPHINGQSLLDIPDLITKIYTTNSIWWKHHEKVEVVKKF